MGERRRGKPLHSSEGHILLAGIVLSLLYVSFLSLCVLAAPRLAQTFVGVTATNVLFGRAAGMSLTYALGFGHAVAMLLNMLIETILVLLFYPLFVFSLKHLLVVGWLRRVVDKITGTAERHREKVRRYGIAGLVFFVWFPFSMTGPLVGCVIGYMIGLRPWVNVGVVIASTWLAIVCWGLLLRDMLEHLSVYSTYAPISAVTALIAFLILVHFIKVWKRKASDLTDT
jgi:uncharacterized membrane protein